MCICFYRAAITLSDPLFPATTTGPRYSVSAASNAPESSAGYDGVGGGGVLVLMCAPGGSTRRDAGGYS